MQFGFVVHLAFAVLAAIFGIYVCGESAKRLGVHDHPGIVWDEITGFAVTMLTVPANWSTVVAGFALFRLFDIWKPWPVDVLDRRVPGGLGIMLDDLLAGGYALLVLHLGRLLLN